MNNRVLTLLVVIAVVSAATGYGLASVTRPTEVLTTTETIPQYVTVARTFTMEVRSEVTATQVYTHVVTETSIRY